MPAGGAILRAMEIENPAETSRDINLLYENQVMARYKMYGRSIQRFDFETAIHGYPSRFYLSNGAKGILSFELGNKLVRYEI